MGLVTRFAILFLSIHAVLGHSLLGDPKPISPNVRDDMPNIPCFLTTRPTFPVSLVLHIFLFLCSLTCTHSFVPLCVQHCRLGGVPMVGGIVACPGPCDIGPLYINRTVAAEPEVTKKYRRGQRVKIKYQRNNHGAGGFVRLSIVPIDQMMNKTAHAANAFHFGCWGDYTILAKDEEMGRGPGGFSLVGGDGEMHDEPIAYYETRAVIPPVIPDGTYVLGWAWYGGMGGSLLGNTVKDPHPIGLFSDYWSCAFVEISGGDRLTGRSTPVFVNGLEEDWPDGCNAANDRPGVCTYEPCIVPGKHRKPMEFASGNPPPVRRNNFRSPDGQPGVDYPLPTEVPDEEVFENAVGALKDCQAELKDPPEEEERGDTDKVLRDLWACGEELKGPEEMDALVDEMMAT